MSEKPSSGVGGKPTASAARHERLRKAYRLTSSDAQSSAEAEAAIFAERARLLAVPAVPDVRGDSFQAVEFTLAHERYAVDTRHVREVAPLDDLTPLPGTPGFVLGLVNLRGEILSVLDLKSFFGLPETGLTDRKRIIFVEDPKMVFGILADSVTGVRQLQPSEVQPPLPSQADAHGEYLIGITRDRVAVLDAARLLADPDLVIDSSSTAAGYGGQR